MKTGIVLAVLATVLTSPISLAKNMYPDGIAAGDITPTTAVLWTRGIESGVAIADVALDTDFKDVAKSKATIMFERNDHAAKIVMAGLEPETRYYFRFRNHDLHSETGSFLTPAL